MNAKQIAYQVEKRAENRADGIERRLRRMESWLGRFGYAELDAQFLSNHFLSRMEPVPTHIHDVDMAEVRARLHNIENQQNKRPLIDRMAELLESSVDGTEEAESLLAEYRKSKETA